MGEKTRKKIGFGLPRPSPKSRKKNGKLAEKTGFGGHFPIYRPFFLLFSRAGPREARNLFCSRPTRSQLKNVSHYVVALPEDSSHWVGCEIFVLHQVALFPSQVPPGKPLEHRSFLRLTLGNVNLRLSRERMTHGFCKGGGHLRGLAQEWCTLSEHYLLMAIIAVLKLFGD